MIAFLVLSGCAPKPRAPALGDETVYQNSQEGFRFLPPPCWTLHARSEAPAGPLDEERLLVEYKCFTSDKPATLDVSMVDVPEDRSLAACLQERADSAEGWKPAGSVEELSVGGKPGARGAFTILSGVEPQLKEIVAIRRGRRVYFFTGVLAPDDARARAAIRKAVASVMW